jgi:hypothetical protein
MYNFLYFPYQRYINSAGGLPVRSFQRLMAVSIRILWAEYKIFYLLSSGIFLLFSPRFTDIRNSESLADFLCKFIGDFGMTRDSLHRSCCRIHPKRMGASLSFEVTTVPTHISGGLPVSYDRNDLANSIFRQSAHSVPAPVVKYK